MFGHVGHIQKAIALFDPAAAPRNQPAEPAVGSPIGRPENHRRRVVGRDLGPDNQLETDVARGRVGSDDAGQAIAISHGQRGQPQLGRPMDQLVGV